MTVRLSKPWRPFDHATVATLTGHLGVYELGNTAGDVLYIGAAGGRSRFGLKGQLMDRLAADLDGACCFRVEVNMAYHSRRIELLEIYLNDHGQLPIYNTDVDESRLGRVRPG
jgi:hypothetical protein